MPEAQTRFAKTCSACYRKPIPPTNRDKWTARAMKSLRYWTATTSSWMRFAKPSTAD